VVPRGVGGYEVKWPRNEATARCKKRDRKRGGGKKNGKREIIREKINEKRERRGITNATMGLG